ncbi:MAG: von Willebrand factor type A domain-containing protein [Bacteroidota bacterium]
MKTKILFLAAFLIALILSNTQLLAQRTITGKVVQADSGDPLVGAAVVIKETTIGAFTDQAGKFSLAIPASAKILEVSYVGFKKATVKLDKRNDYLIKMEDEHMVLEEVVVTGVKSRLAGVNVKKVFRRKNKTRKDQYYPVDADDWGADYTDESYAEIKENEFQHVASAALSTFSIDVDKASYANVRRFLNDRNLPPKDAVRIEELINYFSYEYAEPKGDAPIGIQTELSICPWNEKNQLFRIGLKGKSLNIEEAPESNLVFLLDVSGSMNSEDKLPLLKKSFSLLVDNMRNEDRVAIVVYAGSSGVVLPSTSGKNKERILASLDRLSAGGSTAGGQGLRKAYDIAEKYFIKNGNNRIILATDGDFNVGESSDDAMQKLIEKQRDKGIFLSVLGFGTGNLKDSKMERIADHGNGNYAYIDNLLEAKKVLVNEMSGTLYTIAKDVKLQIEFNPQYVKSYRLIGYENRMLEKEDFNDDTKDAGEMGAGHTVTALYEIVPADVANKVVASIDPLKYQSLNPTETSRTSGEILTVKFRYKEPKGKKSLLITYPVQNQVTDFADSSDDLRFSAAVANFGMLLRQSKKAKKSSWQDVVDMAKASKGTDENGYRAEFIRLVELAELLAKKK